MSLIIPGPAAPMMAHHKNRPRITVREAPMTAYSVTIGLLLAFPWTLVGVILLGAAAASARRWLDNCHWC